MNANSIFSILLNCLKYVIRNSIQPIMKDIVIPEAIQKDEAAADADLEVVTRVLDSLHIFTLSNSQLSIEKKSSLLQNLVHLSLPNVKGIKRNSNKSANNYFYSLN